MRCLYMNKIKKIWMENKVLLVLAIILIICVVIFASVAISYFYGSSGSVYGNRLDATKKVPLANSKLEKIKKDIETNEIVKSAKVNLKGKIVYIIINFKDNTKMEDSQKIAENVLESFTEEELKVYDLEFTISSESSDEKFTSYTLMGAKNSNGSETISWSNYNISEESSVKE